MKKVLSDADVTKLRRTMADVDKLRGQIRTLHDRSKSSKRAGAHYVVKTPSGGIPASVGDEPGSADCNIHIRDGDPKELRDTTRAETVYNFGPAIPGDTILIAHRDAWGDLWAGEISGCAEIGLSPGSYPAVAGATIAAGASGVIAYDGKVITAVNHSKCNVILGDPIGLHIDANCTPFFVPCVCCDSPPDPDPTCADEYPCCRTPFAYCLLAPFGSSGTRSHVGFLSLKDVTIRIPGPLDSPFTIICPDGSQAFLTMVMTCCDDGTPDVTWEVRNIADEVIASGSFSVAGLCDDPPTIERHLLEVPGGCSMVVSFASEYSDELCGEGVPPPSDCCDQSLYFCLNGVSQLLDVDGGTYTWDVSACCDATASLQITLSCNPSTGVISMAWQYTAGAVFDAGAVNISVFCTDGSPRIFDFPGATCFLQMLISQVEFDCAECTGGGTTITTPPVTPPPPGP
jgi:hypothetical protein